MLAELRFVRGAVARKDFIPSLTHFRIENGAIRSFNGTLALCTPIQFDINCTPKAEPFIRAIMNCEETVSLSMTPTGKLSVKSGKFRALIDCIQEETPHVEPDGNPVEINGEALLAAFKALTPFIGDDASRPWSNGVLLDHQSAYATNNICLVEYWVGSSFPFRCNIPASAIKEIVRINEAPVSAQATENSVTFHFPGGKWIRTALLSTEWPDLKRVLDRPSDPVPVNSEIFKALGALKPFADKMGRVFFNNSLVSTSPEDAEGASYVIDGLDMEGVYQIEMLALLEGVAETADFEQYPNPCPFFGHMLRGAIVGMRS